MDKQDHNQALAVAAKAALGSIGMIRKGRSRTWLADRGYMLGVVEFQPSSWSKGTYLNVSLMWLWQPIDYVILEVEPRRVGDFVSFEDTEDLAGEVARVATDARKAMIAILDRFDGLSSVIDYLHNSGRAGSARHLGHLGTAYGLAGDTERARTTLDAALAARENLPSGAWNTLSYLIDARAALGDNAAFRDWVTETVTRTRATLKLPDNPDFLESI